MSIDSIGSRFGSPFDSPFSIKYTLNENGELVLKEEEETEETPEAKRRREEEEKLLNKPAEGDKVEITGVASESGTAEVKKDEAENKIEDYIKSKAEDIKDAKAEDIAGEFQAQNLEELEEEFQRFMNSDNKTVIEGVQGMIDKITSFAEKMNDFFANKQAAEEQENAEIPNAVKEAEDAHNEESGNPNDGLNSDPKAPKDPVDITEEDEEEIPVAA